MRSPARSPKRGASARDDESRVRHGRNPPLPAPPAFAHDKLLIVDFGSQVTQLIARRVREAGVYCEIAPFQSAERAFAELKPKAVILSGGPASVPDEG